MKIGFMNGIEYKGLVLNTIQPNSLLMKLILSIDFNLIQIF